MGFLDEIEKRILIFDGSKGYMMQVEGLPAGASPEQFNLTHPETVYGIHKKYVEAGCDVIQTNTFTGNRVMLEKHGLADDFEEINAGGTRLAKKAADGKAFVAASIGPTGLMFEPFGELDYHMAFDVFSEQVGAVAKGGADLINFETFTDIAEMRAALEAAKQVCDLPVICSMAFEQNKRTLMGTDPLTCARILLEAGADMVGANCSFGPGHMVEIIREMAKTGTYLSVKPNAGMPKMENEVIVYEQSPSAFADESVPYGELNVRLVGGCCGTTPDFIGELKKRVSIKPYEGPVETGRYICSTTECVKVEKGMKTGLLEINGQMTIEDIIDELYEIAYDESEVAELNFADCDTDLPANVIREARSILKKPLILSGGDTEALKKALRIYPGIAGIRGEWPEGCTGVHMTRFAE